MKKINPTYSSKLRLTFGLSFLTLLSSMTNFSTNKLRASSFLKVSESLVGTKTALLTSFSTILSCGIPMTLWTEASLSKSIKNFSSKSIWTLNSPWLDLSFLNSTSKISICFLVMPYDSLYLSSWTWTSMPIATPKS